MDHYIVNLQAAFYDVSLVLSGQSGYLWFSELKQNLIIMIELTELDVNEKSGVYVIFSRAYSLRVWHRVYACVLVAEGMNANDNPFSLPATTVLIHTFHNVLSTTLYHRKKRDLYNVHMNDFGRGDKPETNPSKLYKRFCFRSPVSLVLNTTFLWEFMQTFVSVFSAFFLGENSSTSFVSWLGGPHHQNTIVMFVTCYETRALTCESRKKNILNIYMSFYRNSLAGNNANNSRGTACFWLSSKVPSVKS